MKETQEQLRKLIEQFGSPDANKIAREIYQTEQDLGQYKTPQPGLETLNQIHNQMLQKVRTQKVHMIFGRVLSTIAALAFLVAGIWVIMNETQPAEPFTPVAINAWEIIPQEGSLVELSLELDEIADEIIQHEGAIIENSTNWDMDITEIENSDLLAEANFWKG